MLEKNFGLVIATWFQRHLSPQQGIDFAHSTFPVSPFLVLSKISYLSLVCLLHILHTQLSGSFECWLSKVPSPNVIYLMT